MVIPELPKEIRKIRAEDLVETRDAYREKVDKIPPSMSFNAWLLERDIQRIDSELGRRDVIARQGRLF